MDKILEEKYMPQKEDLESGKLESIEPEKKENTAKVDMLMKTGHFENPEAAQEFLASLDSSLEKLGGVDNDVEKFSSNFEKIVQETQEQMDEIEKMGGSIEEGEKKKMFGAIIQGMYESGEYLNISDEEMSQKMTAPGIINIAKKFGRFVADNKAAFIAFGVFSIFTRFGSGVAHAAETGGYAVDLHQLDSQLSNLHDRVNNLDLIGDSEVDRQENAIKNLENNNLSGEMSAVDLEIQYLHRSVEHLNLTGGNMPEVPIDQVMDHNPSHEYTDLVHDIKEAENDKNAIFLETTVNNGHFEGAHSPERADMENEANHKINDLMEKVKDGPQRVNVKTYHLSLTQEVYNFVNGKYEIKGYSHTMTAITPEGSAASEHMDPKYQQDFKGEGVSPQSAVMEALEQAADFLGVNVSTEQARTENHINQTADEINHATGEHSQENIEVSDETFSERIETSTDEEIRVKNIDVIKTIDPYDGQTTYEAKITIN